MPVQEQEKSYTEKMSQAIAQATRIAQATSEALQSSVQPLIEQGTETVGKMVTPIAEHPLTKYATKVPGINVLMAALGQVNVDQVHKDVEQLRQEYPLETPQQLAHRVVVDTSIKAGGVGLITNFVPPLALTLFAVDIAAVTALQAEMIYRIASIYGFPLKEPTRRGEVLAIFGLSVGGSGVLKAGSSFVELLPVIGALVGASNNAALIYSLGHVACRFYEAKQKKLATPAPAPVEIEIVDNGSHP